MPAAGGMVGAGGMVVDSHVHVASDDADRYPRSPTGIASNWWMAGGHGAERLLAAMGPIGIDRAVVVQAYGVYAHDCRYAVDAVAAHPDRLALVGSVDMDGPDPAAAVVALDAGARTAGAALRGVRLFGVTGPPPRWLADGRARAVWAVAAELGCTLVPTLFADALAGLRPNVEAHPSVPVALDHCGFPDLSGGHPFPAAAPLFALADLPSVHLKVSSHGLLEARAGGGNGGTGGDPADLVDRLAGTFGAHRLCWGSDHPQNQHLTYPAMVALGRHACRRLPEADQATFLGGTAHRLWWSGDTGPGGAAGDTGPGRATGQTRQIR